MPQKVRNINVFYVPAGCVNGCSGHGMCTTVERQYLCECSAGWTGPDCSVQLETICDDEIDNDGGKYNFIPQVVIILFSDRLVRLQPK